MEQSRAMEKMPDKKLNPLMQAALGRAMVRTGIEHEDLDLMRQGRKHQAEAEAVKPSSQPPQNRS